MDASLTLCLQNNIFSFLLVLRCFNDFTVACYIFFFFSRDLGVHIDGFIAVVGHTIVVGASKVSL